VCDPSSRRSRMRTKTSRGLDDSNTPFSIDPVMINLTYRAGFRYRPVVVLTSQNSHPIAHIPDLKDETRTGSLESCRPPDPPQTKPLTQAGLRLGGGGLGVWGTAHGKNIGKASLRRTPWRQTKQFCNQCAQEHTNQTNALTKASRIHDGLVFHGHALEW
jgi:hypothetical protein